MRDYEILYIVRPELDDDQVARANGDVAKLIESLGGTPLRTNVWGKRRLAYEVSHLREGHYVLTDFKLEPARVPELEASLKISETVFRHIVVQKPKKVAAAVAAPPPVPPAVPEAVPPTPAEASAAAPEVEVSTELTAAGEPEAATEPAAATEPEAVSAEAAD